MKILFVKLGAIGDAVMARSLPLAARRLHPDSHFTWLAGRTIAPLVRGFDGVDAVLEADEAALLTGSAPARAAALLRTMGTLAFRSYDLVLTGHSDPRYGLLSALVRAGQRRSFARGRWLPAGRYHGFEYARLLTGSLEPASAASHAPLKGAPLGAELEALLQGPGPALLIFPGGAKNQMRENALRRWPLGHYVAAARLALDKGWRLWLGGAPSDAWVRGAFTELPHTDLIGRCDLPQTLSLCARAGAVLTHDSGPAHLAQAAGARLVALFGPTAPSSFVDPSSRTRALWGGETLACRPCYDGRDFAACSDNLCLAGISPEAVLRVLEG